MKVDTIQAAEIKHDEDAKDETKEIRRGAKFQYVFPGNTQQMNAFCDGGHGWNLVTQMAWRVVSQTMTVHWTDMWSAILHIYRHHAHFLIRGWLSGLQRSMTSRASESVTVSRRATSMSHRVSAIRGGYEIRLTCCPFWLVAVPCVHLKSLL